MNIIRRIKLDDAESFLALCCKLDEESSFMLLEPGERSTTLLEQENQIMAIEKNRNQVIFVAEENGHLIGYIAGLGGSYQRNMHKANIVIGILQAHAGQGLGTQLFLTLENWARAQGLHKLELTVMAHNEKAIALYKKMGFQIEGVSVDSLLVDGLYVDELDMAKILEPRDSSTPVKFLSKD